MAPFDNNGYSSVFGGNNRSPAQIDYVAYTITTDIYTVWPFVAQDDSYICPAKLDINAHLPNLQVFLPDASIASNGQDVLVRNVGAYDFTLVDQGGNTVASIASGLQWLVWIVDDTTVNGQWARVQYGAGASNVQAAALAGAGLRANVTKLDQNLVATPLLGNYTVTQADRATVLENQGGVVTHTFDTAANLGNGWFVYEKNAGTGGVTLTAASGQTIDGDATKVLQPSESCIVVCDGTGLQTIGYGRTNNSNVTGVSINLAPLTSPYSLTGPQVLAQVQDWSGALTSNMILDYGGSVGYWLVWNNTSGAFTVTARAQAGDPGVVVPQSTYSIIRSNGTHMAIAFTATAGTVTEVDTVTGELTGGPITGTGTLGLASTSVSPGTYGAVGAGSTTQARVPIVAFDAKGRAITGTSSYALGTAANYNAGSGPGQVPIIDPTTGLLPTAIGGVATGMIVDYMLATPPVGWIFATGTIGNAASGASNRANADTQALFVGIWNSFPSTTAPLFDSLGNPVSRGTSAINDFNANRRIQVEDFRGRMRVGRDNMLGTSAGRVTNLTATPDGNTMGASGGSEQAAAAVGGIAVSGSLGGTASGKVVSNSPTITWQDGPGGNHTAAAPFYANDLDVSVALSTGSFNGLTAAGSYSTVFSVMSPFAICNVIVKL